MNHRFSLETPDPVSAQPLYDPAFVSGWFLDDRLCAAAQVRVRLGPVTVVCDRVDRPDVAAHFQLGAPSAAGLGFEAKVPCGGGRHPLVIEAETASGAIICLPPTELAVQTWPPPRAPGLRAWLDAEFQALKWALPPGPADSVLVLIPVKPGAPARALAHARMLAERALKGLPAATRIVFDDRGAAASRGEHPWRVSTLAAIRQGMIESHLRDERWVFWADLDLADYPADLVATLIRRAGGGIAAPFVFMANGTTPVGGSRFYDLAGFVEQGRWATPHPPYFKQTGPVYDLDSVGSCYLVPAALYRRGARHEEDVGSRRWIETRGMPPDNTSIHDWENLAYTEHYTVCAFARRHGLPVRAYDDLVALHEEVV